MLSRQEPGSVTRGLKQPSPTGAGGVEQVVGAVQADRHLHGLFLEFRSVILSFRHFRRHLSGKVLLISLSGNSGAPQLLIWLWRAGSISAALTACGGGHCACKSGSGIRSPSRSKPAPVSATARAPPHQTASGDVASSAPPTAGPRATPAMNVRP